MLIILDSNILLSALISPHSPPHIIYQAWQKNIFKVATCREQIDEIRSASRYPKFRNILQPHRVGLMLNNLQKTIVIENLFYKYETKDPNDDWLLALAEEVQADYIVTGDKNSGILERKKIGKTQIVTAQLFCKKLP